MTLINFQGACHSGLGIDDGFFGTIADAEDELTSRKGVREEVAIVTADDEEGGGGEKEPFDRATAGVFWSPADTGTSAPVDSIDFSCSF